MTDPAVIAAFEAVCAACCPHCAAGSTVRYRSETREWVHDYVARDHAIDTPDLARQGGPLRLMPGTVAHTLCQVTDLRNASPDAPA